MDDGRQLPFLAQLYLPMGIFELDAPPWPEFGRAATPTDITSGTSTPPRPALVPIRSGTTNTGMSDAGWRPAARAA